MANCVTFPIRKITIMPHSTVTLFFLVLLLISSATITNAYASTFMSKFGKPGSEDGQLNGPAAIAVDSSGRIYVTDSFNDRVEVFDSSGDFLFKFGTYGAGNAHFSYPNGIAVDSSGKIYVTDYNNDRVQVFDSSGKFLFKFGTRGTGDGQFGRASGIAVDSSGKIYVLDSFNFRIQVFNSTGVFLAKFGTYGTGNGQFYYPNGIAIDSSGKIYVADRSNNNIQVFDTSGNFLSKFGRPGSANGQLNIPTGIALDSSGKIYVADTHNHRIQVFDSTGKFVTKFGAYGAADGQFYYPNDIAIDSSDMIYVADTSNHRIQVFAERNPDNIAPVVIPLDNIIVESTSPAGNIVNYPLATATDNVGVTSGPVCTPSSGSTFVFGSTTVTCLATDAAGNTGKASFTITVRDTTPPSIIPPPDMTTVSIIPTTVSLGLPVVNDIVDSSPTVTNNAPSLFPVGDTIVTWTANDESGNSASATQLVTVLTSQQKLEETEEELPPEEEMEETEEEMEEIEEELPPEEIDALLTETLWYEVSGTYAGMENVEATNIMQIDAYTYEVNIEVEQKVLGFIPVKVPYKGTLELTDPYLGVAELINLEKPFWSFLIF